MRTYIQSTMLYGMIRKSLQMPNSKIEKYDLETNKKVQLPLLMVDKLMITGLSSVASIYMWPMFVWRDLARLEIYINRKPNARLYDLHPTQRSYFDHICS